VAAARRIFEQTIYLRAWVRKIKRAAARGIERRANTCASMAANDFFLFYPLGFAW